MNGDTTDETQDQQSPVIVAPPQTSGTTYMGARNGPGAAVQPGTTGPNAVAAARYFGARQPNDVQGAMTGAALSGNPNLPIEQQTEAVAAATKFQGQRGYQQDLASGMPASQAMAKWGPMLFAPGSPGAMSAIKMQQPQYRNVPGVGLVAITPGGQPRVVMPSKQPSDTETVTEKYPAKEAIPAIQASKGFFGLGAHPAVPEVPATPARNVVYKQPRISAPSATGTAAAPAQSKLEQAKALRKQHPDWTKKQIVDAVNQGGQ